MKSRTAISVIVALMSFVSCKKDVETGTPAKTIEDYLVKNNEITGWALGPAKWTANNITELTTYIDGEAEIYRRHGFVEAAFQEYRGTVNSNPATLKLRVFNQGSNANAASLYSDPDAVPPGAIPWPNGAGEAAQYVRNAGLSQQLRFYRKNLFVLLETDSDTEESLNIVKQFALNVDAKAK